MKRKDLNALAGMSPAQLNKKISELKQREVKIWSEMKAGQRKNTAEGKNIRREIAQISSIMRLLEIKKSLNKNLD